MSELSPVFQQIDAFTAQKEGGKTHNDGTGHAAAYGIDQNAHPDINVMSLTPQQAQAIRHREYWQAINGDKLAEINPKLALIAYDTAIMSGPARAKQFLRQSDGDPQKMLQARIGFQRQLVANHPEKYGAVANNWESRNRSSRSPTRLNQRPRQHPRRFSPSRHPRRLSFRRLTRFISSCSVNRRRPHEQVIRSDGL